VVGGAATARTFLARGRAGGLCDYQPLKRKKVFVAAVFLFCYFYFGQAK
jgi:hypothetical protein